MSTPVLDKTRLFRNALGSFATGVTIVTARSAEGADVGVTANSFNSVSLDPPMVLWSIGKNSSSLAAFMEAERFAVHILAAEQEHLSGRFAKSGTDKFAGLEIVRGHGDVPLLQNCAARFQCRVAFRHEAGDHYILVGEVDEFDHDDHAPLAFHSGRYGLFVRNEPPAAAEGAAPPLLAELLVRAEDALLRRVEGAMGESGLSLAEYEVLRSLVDLPLTLEDLEDWAGPAQEIPTVVLVEDLAERGLLDAPEGGAVSLTDAGRDALARGTAEIAAIEGTELGGLTPHEAQLLRRFLSRIAASAED
ncbi:MAG TPA: flavin reductase [Acidisoma sp.]|uniref:flavin reductase n=1 Tax=Acidisoma sp. TaxID=1872115 RepID=UPI002C92363F|nr:flavin reductase [Acidisoma sp.]HTI02071.1 flavin reductase [Acidisoma sp.]